MPAFSFRLDIDEPRSETVILLTFFAGETKNVREQKRVRAAAIFGSSEDAHFRFTVTNMLFRLGIHEPRRDTVVLQMNRCWRIEKG